MFFFFRFIFKILDVVMLIFSEVGYFYWWVLFGVKYEVGELFSYFCLFEIWKGKYDISNYIKKFRLY